MSILETRNLIDYRQTIAAPLLERVRFPWEVLPQIGEFLLQLGPSLPPEEYEQVGDGIWIARSARIASTACLCGPLIVGKNAEIRHCAFIRGNAIVGEGTVVGNSTELKNVILSNGVQVPHYNYVGDSILGYKAHMGAGSITSNVKSDKTLVTIASPEGSIATGLKKMGAVLGDFVEVGCNSCLLYTSSYGFLQNMLCDQIMVQFILGKKNMSGYPDRLRSLDIFFQIVYKQAFLRDEAEFL